ncbi:uncharacterized protein LOC111795581 isoform X1 [Cucurbita pepo subsp. pepo]|uniref:uncharacterized protein LOC111795581 isoform X1 n=1 Tax=Cucurbita pepo subsp. pepo TaxID=3664 RepID=UPI000C9D7404|nr:uncharacterized protein LOC111795581 isoform X1 [Cucurbita pepo subsp. pepo]
MKLVWSPEMASKAYIDTVQSCDLHTESGVAELISAMAAGRNAQFIVETWSSGGAIATSIGLAVARRHTGGRHVCVVPDERSRGEYWRAMERAGLAPEVIVREPEEVMGGLVGIDFLVVNSERRNFSRVLKMANLSSRGAVLICKNANSRSDSSFRWSNVTNNGTRRLIRSAFLPVGQGLDIAYVAAEGRNSGSGEGKGKWIKQVDRRSGEEFVIRK